MTCDDYYYDYSEPGEGSPFTLDPSSSLLSDLDSSLGDAPPQRGVLAAMSAA